MDKFLNDETETLLSEANKNILYVTDRPDIVMEKGKGMYLWDTNGKKYLDFIAGWAVNCIGHSPDIIAEVLEKQARILVNASPAFYNKPMIQFAKLLTDNSCFEKVFFASSGAEANESAIKLARKYGAKYLNGAYEIITTINGFHGRTLATMSASGKEAWKNLFLPKIPGFTHLVYNDIEALISSVNENTCAIMIEPIQGEGGVNEAEFEYIKKIRKICDEKSILLIFDEVQTGIGRTGRLFAYENYGIEPDIMTLAKGIGGGFPLSAMLTKNKFDIFDKGDQGGTYTGQPLAMAVGYAVVNEVIEKKLWEDAAKQGNYIMKRLNELKADSKIKSFRGMGLLIGIELFENSANDIVEKCLMENLIINAPNPSLLRLMPALTVEKEDIDKMFDILVKNL